MLPNQQIALIIDKEIDMAPYVNNECTEQRVEFDNYDFPGLFVDLVWTILPATAGGAEISAEDPE